MEIIVLELSKTETLTSILKNGEDTILMEQ